MREAAEASLGSAAVSIDCPKCNAVAKLMVPMKVVSERIAVYGCSACGYAFKADGGVYLDNTEKLADHFRGATAGHRTLVEALAGEKLNPATKTLLQAMLIEYGTTMWFDGLKQGLLLGAKQLEYGDKVNG